MIEYLVENLGPTHTSTGTGAQSARLTELGAEGWRMCGVVGTTGYFMRETEDETPEGAEETAPEGEEGENRGRRRRGRRG